MFSQKQVLIPFKDLSFNDRIYDAQTLEGSSEIVFVGHRNIFLLDLKTSVCTKLVFPKELEKFSPTKFTILPNNNLACMGYGAKDHVYIFKIQSQKSLELITSIPLPFLRSICGSPYIIALSDRKIACFYPEVKQFKILDIYEKKYSKRYSKRYSIKFNKIISLATSSNGSIAATFENSSDRQSWQLLNPTDSYRPINFDNSLRKNLDFGGLHTFLHLANNEYILSLKLKMAVKSSKNDIITVFLINLLQKKIVFTFAFNLSKSQQIMGITKTALFIIEENRISYFYECLPLKNYASQLKAQYFTSLLAVTPFPKGVIQNILMPFLFAEDKEEKSIHTCNRVNFFNKKRKIIDEKFSVINQKRVKL